VPIDRERRLEDERRQQQVEEQVRVDERERLEGALEDVGPERPRRRARARRELRLDHRVVEADRKPEADADQQQVDRVRQRRVRPQEEVADGGADDEEDHRREQRVVLVRVHVGEARRVGGGGRRALAGCVCNCVRKPPPGA